MCWASFGAVEQIRVECVGVDDEDTACGMRWQAAWLLMGGRGRTTLAYALWTSMWIDQLGTLQKHTR